MRQKELILGAAGWVVEESGRDFSPAPPRSISLEGGRLLLSGLKNGAVTTAPIDSVCAAVALLGAEDALPFECAVRLHELISGLPDADPDEIGELLMESSFHCWRFARIRGASAEESRWRRRIREVADRTSPVKERIADFVLRGDASALDLFTFAEMLVVCDHLRESLQRSPTVVRASAEEIRGVLIQRREDAPRGARVFLLDEIASLIEKSSRRATASDGMTGSAGFPTVVEISAFDAGVPAVSPGVKPEPGHEDLGRTRADEALAVRLQDRTSKSLDLCLDHPETLQAVGARLRELMDRSPVLARQEAEFFFTYVSSFGESGKWTWLRGEFALLAGAACRQLGFNDEARVWFDRAEHAFGESENSASDILRLEYQRLALSATKREMEMVLERAPALGRDFRRLGMAEDELKARFLEGIALMESDRLEEAADLYRQLCVFAAALHSERLLAQACANLAHVYGLMGDSRNALDASSRAIPLLRAAGDRVGIAKLQWGMAALLRQRGQLDLSIEAYADAQTQFEEMGMRGDVAALHLAIAGMLLEQGKEQEALDAVLAALPVIDELKMVPEGMAAMALLRESVSRQRVNRKALRELHGYFDERKKR